MSLTTLDRSRWPQVGMVLTYFEGVDSYGVGTATLIHPGAVLTAAHVVAPGTGVAVSAFDVLLNDGTQIRQISPGNACVRGEWAGLSNRPSEFDYGLILLGTRLTTPLAVVLPTQPDQLMGQRLSVVGFPGVDPDFGKFMGGSDLGRDSLGPPENVFSIQYPVPAVPGMSGGPVYLSTETAGSIFVRGIHTNGLSNGDGNGLVILPHIEAQIQSWLLGA